MRFSTIYSSLLTAAFAGSAIATVNITTPESPVHVGDEVEVEYTTDRPYNLELVFAVKGTTPGIAWSTVKTYFERRETPSGNGSFIVEVPNVSPEGDYAFWLCGSELQGNSGYANLTDWFKVEGGKKDNPRWEWL